MAQVYNHMICRWPTRRDKRTQVIWGIRDFEYRFGRLPKGMWLAETAVDLETLDILAEQGIKFTILAPHQAAAVQADRRAKTGTRLNGGQIDPTTRLPAAGSRRGTTITSFSTTAPSPRPSPSRTC